MKNLKYTSILNILLICVTLIAIFAFLKPDRETNGAATQQSSRSSALVKMKADLWNGYVDYVKSEGHQIPSNLKLSDTTGKIHLFSEMIDTKAKLIFRYSFRDCEICVDTVLNKIALYQKTRHLKDFIIITDSYSERDFMIKASRQKSLKIYNLQDTLLGLNIENQNYPFLFVTGKDLKVSKIFLPIKEIPDQITEYFDYIDTYLKQTNR